MIIGCVVFGEKGKIDKDEHNILLLIVSISL